MSIQSDAEKLVTRIISKASQDDTELCDAVEALKIVTAYLVAAHKFSKDRDEDDEEGSFATFQRDLVDSEDEDGGAKVRSRRQ